MVDSVQDWYSEGMQLNPFYRRIIALTAIFMAAVCQGGVVERPLSTVPLDTALMEAQKLAARRAGQVLRIEGHSMLPYFGEGSVVVIKKVDQARLRSGMVVVYRNRFGETVAHRLVAASGAGWVVQGYNNTATDSTLVDASNLLGVVYATFHSSGQTSAPVTFAALVSSIPVALAGPAK